jgi:intracellular septation protein
MKQIAEFIPIALFFIVYQLDGQSVSLLGWTYHFDGIYSATAVLMIATVLQVVFTFALTRQFEKRLMWLAAAVLIFGGATLFFHNQMQRTLGSQIHLPKPVWTRLNLLWTANFLVVGGLNLFVAYGFSESTWVSYKMYSAIGFTLVLALLTAFLISPHLKEDAAEEQQ